MAVSMNSIAVQGRNPGEVYIPALDKTFKQIELREDDVMDTVEIVLGAQSSTEYEFFKNLDNKKEQHTNIGTPRRIQSGDEVAVFRVGLHPREANGNALPIFNDYRKVFGNAHYELIFNRRLITEGPAIKYPSGLGLGGYSDETGATAVSVGIASMAAAPTLFVPQQLKDDDGIKAKVRFPTASWVTGYTAPTLTGAVLVSNLLHGIMKAPLGK